MTAEPFLDARLDVRRGDFHLRADLTVDEHARVGIIGPNGAGKSTLLAALAGYVGLSNGDIRLDERILDDAASPTPLHVPVHRRGIVACEQDPRLFAHLNVRGNIAYGPRSLRWSRDQTAAAVSDLIRRLGLDDLADRDVRDLSAGQAQRVALARALATRPRVLLLDEPFAVLDVTVAADLRASIAALLAERGTTTLFVSHALVDIAGLADRVVVLESGRIVDDGPPARVLRQPRSAFAAELAGVTALEGHASGGGFVTAAGWRVPLDGPVAAGVTRLFVPPEAVELSAVDGPPGDGVVRIETVAAAPTGVAVTVRPGDGPPVRLFAPATAAWLGPGERARLRVNRARSQTD